MNSLFHFVRFLFSIDEPHSQVTRNELTMLIKYAQGANLAVELGCYEGKTTVALAKSINGVVYSIDPFFPGRLKVNYGKLIAQLHAKRNKVSNIILIEAFSWHAAKNFNKTIDFLFIDADHSYDAILRDWNDWTPKLREEGIVILHDVKKTYNSPSELGTMKFYRNELPSFKQYREIDSIDSMVVLKKSAGS